MPSVHSRLVGRKGPAILSTMNFIAPLLVFLLIAAVLTAGIVMAAAVKGSAILLLLGGAAFTGLFIKFGCLDHH
jgi:hypothetical protein